MAVKRARIKDHIARGDMTDEEALELEKKGFKNRNMYITIPEKPVSAKISSPEEDEDLVRR